MEIKLDHIQVEKVDDRLYKATFQLLAKDTQFAYSSDADYIRLYETRRVNDVDVAFHHGLLVRIPNTKIVCEVNKETNSVLICQWLEQYES